MTPAGQLVVPLVIVIVLTAVFLALLARQLPKWLTEQRRFRQWYPVDPTYAQEQLRRAPPWVKRALTRTLIGNGFTQPLAAAAVEEAYAGRAGSLEAFLMTTSAGAAAQRVDANRVGASYYALLTQVREVERRNYKDLSLGRATWCLIALGVLASIGAFFAAAGSLVILAIVFMYLAARQHPELRRLRWLIVAVGVVGMVATTTGAFRAAAANDNRFDWPWEQQQAQRAEIMNVNLCNMAPTLPLEPGLAPRPRLLLRATDMDGWSPRRDIFEAMRGIEAKTLVCLYEDDELASTCKYRGTTHEVHVLNTRTTRTVRLVDVAAQKRVAETTVVVGPLPCPETVWCPNESECRPLKSDKFAAGSAELSEWVDAHSQPAP